MPVSCLGPIGKEMLLFPSQSWEGDPSFALKWLLSFCWAGDHVDVRGDLPAYAAVKQPEWVQEYCSFLPSAHQHSDSFVPYRQQLTTHLGTGVGAFPGRPLQQSRAFHWKPDNIKANILPPQNCLSSGSAICIILWGLVQVPGFLEDLSNFYLGILPFLFFFSYWDFIQKCHSSSAWHVWLMERSRRIGGYLTQWCKQLSLIL